VRARDDGVRLNKAIREASAQGTPNELLDRPTRPGAAQMCSSSIVTPPLLRCPA
jgi:hypothetical protein